MTDTHKILVVVPAEIPVGYLLALTLYYWGVGLHPNGYVRHLWYSAGLTGHTPFGYNEFITTGVYLYTLSTICVHRVYV